MGNDLSVPMEQAADGGTVFELDAMPAVAPLVVAAFQARNRKAADDVDPPKWTVRVNGVRADPERLARYRKVCGFTDADGLPILYPQVLAAPLHMNLMTRDGWPFAMLGMIHMQNLTLQTRPIADDETFSLAVRVDAIRPSRFGLEFDLITELFDSKGEIPWRATTTILQRGAKRETPPGRQPQPEPVGRKLSHYTPLEAPANIGRQYARAAQDYNPIHLSRRSAKMLGFERAIAHGMWEAAACTAGVPHRPGGWRRHEVRFRQPFFLPGKAVIRHYEAGTDDAKGYDFALVGGEGTVYLEGRVR